MVLGILILTSLLFNIGLQALATASLSKGLQWIYLSPVQFVFSTLFILTLQCVIWSVSGALKRTIFFTCSFLSLLGAASYLKVSAIGKPLFPADFAVLSDLYDLSKNIFHIRPFEMSALIVLSLIVLGIAWQFWNLLKSDFLGTKFRCILGGIAASLLLVVCLANNPIHQFFFEQQFHFSRSRSDASLSENGLIINFILMLRQGQLPTPSHYNFETLERLNSTYKNTESLAQNRQPASVVHPDIVVVMSESLFDPLRLKGLRWKKDPLKFTRSLMNNEEVSNAIVPTFGGKTANTEFEFLTGHSIRFFSPGTVPYKSYIETEQLSIPRILREQGYRTVAIHPGLKAFWNRENVYPFLGFSKFIYDEDFLHATRFGNFISDESILEVLKTSMQEDSSPSFHFIVTIQNHMPYDNPFDFKDMLFEDQNLQPGEKVVLNHYSKLVQASDHFHESLVTYLKSRKRPTVLLLFGDHLPSLMDNFGVYSGRLVETQDRGQWTQADFVNMYSTPLVTWSNFPLKKEDKPIEISFVGVRLLHQLGIELPPYYNFLNELSHHLSVVNPNLEMPHDANLKKWVQDYKVFQYETLTSGVSTLKTDRVLAN